MKVQLVFVVLKTFLNMYSGGYASLSAILDYEHDTVIKFFIHNNSYNNCRDSDIQCVKCHFRATLGNI